MGSDILLAMLLPDYLMNFVLALQTIYLHNNWILEEEELSIPEF